MAKQAVNSSELYIYTPPIVLMLVAKFALYMQGLTLRFQARGPKRSFDKKLVVKNRISGYFTYSLGPLV